MQSCEMTEAMRGVVHSACFWTSLLEMTVDVSEEKVIELATELRQERCRWKSLPMGLVSLGRQDSVGVEKVSGTL